jgi:hypothetical protein
MNGWGRIGICEMTDQENRRTIARGLLGGYATGTLSDAERKLLFEVAMEDQEIFDELGREQALKEMLETPGVRDRLAASLVPTPAMPRARGWLKPLMFGLATLFVVGVSLTAVMLSRNGDRNQIAQLEQPAQPVKTAPAPIAPPTPAHTEEPRAEKPKSAPGKPAAPAATSVPQGSSIAIANGSIAAAPPPPPPVPEQRRVETADARVKDGRAGFMPLAASPAQRFAFDYAVDGQDLVLKFYANGYFSLHIAPGGLTIVDSRVTAGETRREHITQNGTEASVTFSAAPQAAPGGVSIERGKDALTGTVEDPSRTRIDFLLKFFWY